MNRELKKRLNKDKKEFKKKIKEFTNDESVKELENKVCSIIDKNFSEDVNTSKTFSNNLMKEDNLKETVDKLITEFKAEKEKIRDLIGMINQLKDQVKKIDDTTTKVEFKSDKNKSNNLDQDAQMKLYKKK